MLQASELFRHGLLPDLVAHAERVHRDAASQINILFSLFVVHQRALALRQAERKTRICMRDILFIQRLDIFHNITPLSTVRGNRPSGPRGGYLFEYV